MTAVLRSINLALGAGLIILGLALPFAAFIDTGHAPGTDALRLIQFHMVLTGGAAALSFAGRGLLLTTALWLIAVANLAVAAMAAAEALYWPLLLAASSAFALISTNDKRNEALAEALRLAEAPLDDLPPTDYAARPSADDSNAGLAAVVNVLFITALGAVVTFFGGAYFDLLFAAIVAREPVDLAAALQNLDDGAVAGAMAQIRTELIAATAALAAGAAFWVFWGQMLRERIDAVAPDFDRALSPAERAYVMRAFDALAARFGDAPPSAWSFHIRVAAVTLVLMMAIMSVMFLGFAAESAIGARLAATRIGAADPVAYHDALTAGAAMSALAFLTVIAALVQFAGERFPALGRWFYVSAGWLGGLGVSRSAGSLTFEAARQVRRRMLDVAAPFDIGAFLDIAFQEYASLVYKIAGAVAAVAAFLVAADLSYFRIADETGVRYANYGRFVEQRVALADLDRVELGCVMINRGELRERVRLHYILVKDGAFRFDILEGGWFRDRIDRLEAFDRAVAAAGVPFMRAERVDPLVASGPGFIPTCAEEIAARYDPALIQRYDADLAPRLIRLMRAGGADAPAP